MSIHSRSFTPSNPACLVNLRAFKYLVRLSLSLSFRSKPISSPAKIRMGVFALDIKYVWLGITGSSWHDASKTKIERNSGLGRNICTTHLMMRSSRRRYSKNPWTQALGSEISEPLVYDILGCGNGKKKVARREFA